LLDPIADKLLIFRLRWFRWSTWHRVPAWMVILIIAVNLRSPACVHCRRGGYTIEASDLGKTKMVRK